jgi:DNA-binding transcriptional MerR regulator
MLIGRVVEETGLSRDTVRYYERRGLIAPAYRRDNGYKEYGEENSYSLLSATNTVAEMSGFWSVDHLNDLQLDA